MLVEVATGANLGTYPVGEIAQGGQTDLRDTIARVLVDLTNTGSVNGTEVAQLYVAIPGAPEKQLRCFETVSVGAGQTVTVVFELCRRDLSVWVTAAQKWKLQKADLMIYVGSSSRKLPLRDILGLSW